MIDLRLRSKVPEEELEEKKGKLLNDEDYNLLLTRAARIRKPDGRLLCAYLPGTLTSQMQGAWPILTKVRMKSDNRGLASGTKRINAGGTRTRAMPVMSGILGSLDPTPRRPYCRLNAYSREHLDKWEGLFPLLQEMAAQFAAQVPDRFSNQQAKAEGTHKDWMVPGTPFTTVTINNTYSTGVHTDKGDLDEGFSCLAVARSGNFVGGRLTFPEYRVAVDMQDGDLLLMDAHDWHGNTGIVCECGKQLKEGPCDTCEAERISVVAYYRTEMTACGSKAAEDNKMHELAEAKA